MFFQGTQKSAWIEWNWQTAKKASLREIVITIYQGLRLMQSCIRQTVDDFPTNDTVLMGCRKLQADFSTFPKSLLGLSRYVATVDGAGALNLVQSVLFALKFYTCIHPQTGVRYVYCRAGLIDCLPRLEWWPHEKLICVAKRQAMQMAELVLHKASGVKCRPYLLERAARQELTHALQFGLVALDSAVKNAFEKHDAWHEANPGYTLHRDCRRFRDAQEIKLQFGGYSCHSWAKDHHEQRHDEKHHLEQLLESWSMDLVKVLLRRVMECLIHSTQIVEERRVVVDGPPEPFPT
jgi:hypothetical protein